MKRREFIGGVVATLVMVACDGGEVGDDTGGDTDTDPDTDLTCVIGDGEGDSNIHGHTITIPVADLEDPAERTYTSSQGGHTHNVTISAAEMEALVDNCTVTVDSNDIHAHTWTIFLPES